MSARCESKLVRDRDLGTDVIRFEHQCELPADHEGDHQRTSRKGKVNRWGNQGELRPVLTVEQVEAVTRALRKAGEDAAADVVEFVRARLREREQAAEGTGRIAWLTYRDADGQMLYTTVASDDGDGDWVVDGGPATKFWASAQVVYDERQVLAEVAALRAVVERFELLDRMMDEPRTDTLVGEWSGLRQAVTALAHIWADHPDYDPAWS